MEDFKNKATEIKEAFEKAESDDTIVSKSMDGMDLYFYVDDREGSGIFGSVVYADLLKGGSHE